MPVNFFPPRKNAKNIDSSINTEGKILRVSESGEVSFVSLPFALFEERILSRASATNGFYRSVNGVTIRAPSPSVGSTGVIDGVTYTKVDNDPGDAAAPTSVTTGVTEMINWFFRSSFNGDISHWDTSSVTSMSAMFILSTFNQDISDWDTSNVISMDGVFESSQFNQDISGWDTNSVTNMRGMFRDSPFNQNIGEWDTSNVTDMRSMFQDASSFNQDISLWDYSNVTNLTEFLDNATSFSQANYDKLLIRWADQVANDGMSTSITTTVSSNYTLGGAAESARNYLTTAPNSWSITDLGGI